MEPSQLGCEDVISADVVEEFGEFKLDVVDVIEKVGDEPELDMIDVVEVDARSELNAFDIVEEFDESELDVVDVVENVDDESELSVVAIVEGPVSIRSPK